jgi:uncharacterized membrane protein
MSYSPGVGTGKVRSPAEAFKGGFSAERLAGEGRRARGLAGTGARGGGRPGGAGRVPGVRGGAYRGAMGKPASEHGTDFESFALTRTEYISAIIHLYRGEMHRSLTWRQRLDTTTNWAVFTTGAMLSFLFSQRDHHHVVAILGMLLVLFMLCYEARRFRYFDAWRSRVRKLEENFYAPLLRRDLTSPVQNWGFLVAEDLLTPRFKIGFLVAMRARLLRNYVPLFLVLMGAWLIKLSVHPPVPDHVMEGVQHVPLDVALRYANVGALPAWVVLTLVAALAAFLLGVCLFATPPRTKEQRWWSARAEDSMDEIS